jgi:Zn-dependent peptidase ImmA (M78 family)
MTVKCLNEQQKNDIEVAYLNNYQNQKELAAMYGVSDRTINRVLVERGLLTPTERWTVEQQTILNIVRQHRLSVGRLIEALKLYSKGSQNAA